MQIHCRSIRVSCMLYSNAKTKMSITVISMYIRFKLQKQIIITQYCDVRQTRGKIPSPDIHSLPCRKIWCCCNIQYSMLWCFSWLAKQCMSKVHGGSAGEVNQWYLYGKASGKVTASSLIHMTSTSGPWNRFAKVCYIWNHIEYIE